MARMTGQELQAALDEVGLSMRGAARVLSNFSDAPIQPTSVWRWCQPVDATSVRPIPPSMGALVAALKIMTPEQREQLPGWVGAAGAARSNSKPKGEVEDAVSKTAPRRKPAPKPVKDDEPADNSAYGKDGRSVRGAAVAGESIRIGYDQTQVEVAVELARHWGRHGLSGISRASMSVDDNREAMTITPLLSALGYGHGELLEIDGTASGYAHAASRAVEILRRYRCRYLSRVDQDAADDARRDHRQAEDWKVCDGDLAEIDAAIEEAVAAAG